MRPVVKGSIDQSVIIRIVDSADGTPETGVVFNTSGIDLWYRREGAAKVSITEASLSALTDAHSDGGILHIGDGYYRLDLPDAAVATGANGVMVGGTVTGMVVLGDYVPLTDVNPYDAVRGGMTALPNAAAEAAGGLFTRGSGAGQINQPANGRIDTNVVAMATDTVSAAALASSAVAEIQSGLSTLDAAAVRAALGLASANLDTQLAAVSAAIAAVAGYVDTEVAAIKAKTDNLPVDPADASDIAASFASISSAVATLAGYVDTEVAAIKAKTDKLTFDGANNVAANAKAINDTALTGNGTAGTPWGKA